MQLQLQVAIQVAVLSDELYDQRNIFRLLMGLEEMHTGSPHISLHCITLSLHFLSTYSIGYSPWNLGAVLKGTSAMNYI